MYRSSKRCASAIRSRSPIDVINGGYIHDDGEYTEEKTIVLTFIDVDKATVESIAQDLCELFNQESVLITIGLVKTQMIYAAGSTDEQK